MPRFHFNVHDGVSFTDSDGLELPSWEEARSEAIRYAGEVLKNNAQRIAIGEDWYMEVTDATGLVLFRLNFHVLEAPAMLGSYRNKFNPPKG